jgi:hypothetical protein
MSKFEQAGPFDSIQRTFVPGSQLKNRGNRVD